MKCFANNVPGDRARRDAIEKAVDNGIGHHQVVAYDVGADQKSDWWDVRFRFEDGRSTTLKVFPEHQPNDEKDERKLRLLTDLVARSLGG